MFLLTLLDLIKDKYKIVSIVGMAKNSGKTVTLNHIIESSIYEGITLGITSTGRDGESTDVVTETEKPKIFVEEGTLVATTTDTLSLGDAKVEIMNVTDYRTPLGPIVIGRVRDSGYIQIAGPQTVKETKEVCEILLDLGAKCVIVDGALDRLSSAAPSMSEGTVLATGAVLSRDMNKVVEKTLHTVNIFKLPKVKDERALELIKDIMNSGKVAIIDKDYNIEYINIKTALSCGSIIGDNIKETSKYIVLPGSLVKNTIEDLMRVTRRYKEVTIVIKDGTKVFVGSKDWLRFQKCGINVEVLEPINLIGITLNPYSPQGYYFEPKEFLEKMKNYIKDVPVFDVALGGD